MLPKKLKLPLQNFVGKRGRVIHAPLVTVKIFPPEMAHSRFGVVISAKVNKKAVIRNRIKRAIFNTIHGMLEQIPVADYVIIVAPATGKLDRGELQETIYKLLIEITK